jgi:hypothetical protein
MGNLQSRNEIFFIGNDEASHTLMIDSFNGYEAVIVSAINEETGIHTALKDNEDMWDEVAYGYSNC